VSFSHAQDPSVGTEVWTDRARSTAALSLTLELKVSAIGMATP
jgi:hypothetical protein